MIYVLHLLQCDYVVETYGPLAIKFITTELTPKEICEVRNINKYRNILSQVVHSLIKEEGDANDTASLNSNYNS